MKTWIARRLRAIGETPWVPVRIARAAHRAAFAFRPHELRCRHCGQVFVQPRAGSVRHAEAAFQHWVDEHETDAEIGAQDA